MTDTIKELGYLAGGSRLRRIYEKLQIGGDKAYKDAGFNFKSSWFPVYYVLSMSSSPLTIMEITAQIAFSHITVKNIIRELDQEGLVKVVGNPKDKRSKLVSLSGKGQLLLNKLEPIWTSFSTVLKDVFSLGHPEMTNILTRIDKALEEIPLNVRMDQLNENFIVRNAHSSEFEAIGELMVKVYSQLDGFPSAKDQPRYYEMLVNIGALTKQPATELLVAISQNGKIGGSVVYFSDMKYYGSGGTATLEQNASGFRLLAVDQSLRGRGLGKFLSMECIRKAKKDDNKQLIIHSTEFMQIAWKMYERLGFERSEDLDFMQQQLPAFGFRLAL